MAKLTRILVIGAGLIGIRHVDTVLDHKRCELAGVVDPNPDLALPAGVKRFASIAEVNVPVDGAIIATPTGLHAAHARACAERGWHLLIEKPVAGTPAEADQIDASVTQHNVFCLVGHHRRYHPAVQKLRQMVRDGDIGTPITSSLIWAMRKPDAYFNTDWRRSGGSPVMINLVHDIDLMRFVLGEITEMVALGAHHQRNAGRVESGAAALRFDSGLTATISFADTTPSPWGFESAMGENPNIGSSGQDMWWITGTKGGVAFPSLTLWHSAPDWSQAPDYKNLQVNTVIPLYAQLDHFCDVIHRKQTPIIDVADARKTLQATCDLEELLAPAPV